MFKYHFCLCCNKVNVGPEGNNTLLRMLYTTLTSDKANYDEVQKMHICPSCYLRLKLGKLYKEFFSRIRERLDKSDALISREFVTRLGDTVIGSECPVCFIPKPDAFHIYLHLQASQHCMGCNADVKSLRQHYADRPECMSPINKESRTAAIHICSGLCGASFTRRALLDIHQSQCAKVPKFFAATNPQVINPMPNNITLVFMPQTQLVPVNYQQTLVYNGGFLNFFEQRQPIIIQEPNIQVVQEMQAQHEEILVNETVEKNAFENIETSITSEAPVSKEIFQQLPTEQVHENDLLPQITITPKCYNKRQVCPLCGGNFFRIQRHMLTHNASHCFKCVYCNKSYKNKSNFDLHQNYQCKLRPNKEKDDATAKFFCNDCGKRFNCIALLKLHKRSSHSKISCKICKKVIPKGSYGVHMQLHSDQKEVICEYCGKNFRNVLLLKAHNNRVHATNKRIFQCDQCEFNTVCKASFQRHLSSHEVGERNQKCDQCDKMFFSHMSLKTHINNVHMKEQRSVICPTCGVTLGSAFSLKVHERRHTGIKPYSCDVCGKTFSQRPPLTLHLRTQHNRGSPLVESCPHCDKRFSSKHLLKTHLIKVH